VGLRPRERPSGRKPAARSAVLPHSRAHSVRRGLPLFLSGFIAILFLGDFVLSVVPFPHLEGGTNETRWKFELLEGIRPAPDVLFIGCSYEQNGIMPTVVDARVGEMLGRPITSANLSASCTSALTASLMARRVVESDRRPRVIYLGVCPRNTDAGYARWMEYGLRAFSRPGDWPLTWTCEPSLFAESVLAGTFRSYHRWRECRRAAEAFFQGAPIEVYEDTYLSDRGWEKFDVKEVRPIRDDSAYQAGLADYFSRQPGYFDTGNPNERALRQIIAELRSVGVVPKLIEMPLTETARGMFRREVRDGYRRMVHRLVTDTGVSLVRVPEGFMCADDFQDLEHLFPAGAAKFSHWLADDVASSLVEGDRQTLLSGSSFQCMSGVGQ
jgi:hypothetical protein